MNKEGDVMTGCVRKVLPNVKDFKRFWKDQGPFRYALTAADFPPVLLEPEEWIFGNDATCVLKSLMGFEAEKMAFVQAPFNPDNTQVLRPQDLIPWKISHFPEAWNAFESDIFNPEGHLTRGVDEERVRQGLARDKEGVEKAFFTLLSRRMDDMGYVWLLPRAGAKSASIAAYLKEWEEDEEDAGLI